MRARLPRAKIVGEGEGEVLSLKVNMVERYGPYRRILTYLRPYRGQFVAALLCLIVYGATDGIVPFLVKEVLDGIFTRGDKHLLYVLPVVLIAFAVVRGAADFGQQFLMSRIGHFVVRDVRNALNEHLLKLSSAFYLRNSAASLLSRVTSDVVLVRSLLTDSLSSILRDSIRVVVLIGSALYLDPILAVIALAGFPVGIYPVYRFGRRLRKLSRRGQDAIGLISARLQESILGHRVVKIFSRERYEAERFADDNEKLTATFVKSEVARAITGPINEVLAAVAISGVILYGGFSVIGGARTQGDFIAFLIAVFLLYDPFKKLSRVNASVQQSLAGAERIFEILDTPVTTVDPAQPRVLGVDNSIRFENVSFAYTPDGPLVLRDISIEVPQGRTVALVGFSGAGKSTLVDLIARFIDPTSGVVSIGGTDVRAVSVTELRSRIAMVGQHTFLFNDSIFANIAYGNPSASREEVVAAARAAQAEQFISQLPAGFDTVVGEGGFSLSGGERQRIAIARAILKDAPILILDEATASLDNRAEKEVQAALEALATDRTTVVIAHRLSTVQSADAIVVLRDGQVVECGSHEELLKRGGEYEKLHRLQFREELASADSYLN